MLKANLELVTAADRHFDRNCRLGSKGFLLMDS